MINKSVKERIQEFAVYHRDGDGECNAILLREYANRHNLSRRERFDLAFFFSITYCCESGIILLANKEQIQYYQAEFEQLKRDMIFQSDRKYIKMKDRFKKLLDFWRVHLQKYDTYKWFIDGVLNLDTAISDVEKWYMFGRFSAFLFLETYATLLDAEVSNTCIDWINGDTATSGLLNLFGDDSYANEFDKNGILKISIKEMNTRFNQVASAIEETGGDTNTTKMETSLCAYRKFHKGTRYNGYYLDRMLEELNWYQKNRCQYQYLTYELFKIREKIFPDELLGEKHGWTGIRKEAKKLYVRYGII